MAKQLNIIISDEEAETLEKLRRAHPQLPTQQGLARALFRHMLSTKSVMRDVLNLKVERRGAS
jgi:hypothetical protein